MTTQTTETAVAVEQEALSDEQLKAQLLDAQATEIAELQARIRTLQQRVDILKQAIIDSGVTPGKYLTISGQTVNVRHGATRLNTARFTRDYPQSSHPEAYEDKPLAASKLIKLYGTQALDKYLDEGTPTITIN